MGPAPAQRAIAAELARRTPGAPRHRKALTGLRVPPDVTLSDQRRRIFAATVEEVLAVGLGATSVLRIANRAEVSKATFYEHFPNKRECLWATYEDAERRLRSRIAGGVIGEPDWPAEVRSAALAALRFFAPEPQALFLLTREGAAADERIAKRSQAALRELAARLREGRDVTTAALPDVTEQTLIESAVTSATERLRDGDAASLADLAPELTEFLLTPYLGVEEARRVAAGTA